MNWAWAGDVSQNGNNKDIMLFKNTLLNSMHTYLGSETFKLCVSCY